MNNYLKVYYGGEKPITSYPRKLIKQLTYHYYNFIKGGNVLEIGCGRGEFSQEFYNQGYTYKGTDIDIHPDNKLPVILNDISKERLPFNVNSFDVVFHKSLIEHLDSPNNLMKETYRVLKPEGLVIFLTPNWNSQYRTFYDDFTHKQPYTLNAVRDLLKSYNFNIIDTQIFYQLPITFNSKFLKSLCHIYSFFINNKVGRFLSKITGIKTFRWATESMILGVGKK